MMPALRIALISETYFPQVNGVSRTLDRLVDHLASGGDRVELFLPRYREPGPPLPWGVGKTEFLAFPLPFYREVLLPFTSPPKMVRELEAFRPHLIHIATEGPLGWAALIAAGRLDIPVVSSYHTNFSQYLASYRLGLLEPVAWRYLRWFHNRTMATFCPTDSIRRLLLNKRFRNVMTWGRGVDSRRFHPCKRDQELRKSWGVGPDEMVLAYAGRLAVEKNLDMLMKAWRLLGPGTAGRLLLIGDGPLRPKLEKQSDDRVIYAGFKQGEDLTRFYASADLLAFPSLSDTFGNVLLEGMASGLPAVGFRVPGPQDVIRDGETGCLADTISAETLFRKLMELLTEPGKVRKMGAAARRYAESQSWESILGRLRENYLGVLGQAAGPNPDIHPLPAQPARDIEIT
jgi:glycosyltransferase involved in cell wall biosynthesis